MQILITGGAGFIGSHLAEQFASDGHDVVALDNFEPYYDARIKRYNVSQSRSAAKRSDGSYELVRGDVRNRQLINDQISNADIVFHQAAQAGVRASVKRPVKVNEINVEGTLNVLEGAREFPVERVVMASSSSVYGKPEYLPYDEEHLTNPVSPYGVSKLATEHYARVFYELFDVPTVSLRYFTVYGSRMRPNMAISNFVSRCDNDKAPIIYGDGTQTRDFTHIDDVVQANKNLLKTSSADGGILNIGSTDNISIKELAVEIRDQLAPNRSLMYDERHDADAAHTHADVSKAKNQIDYEPSVTIEEGISEFIDWYQSNENWYGDLVRES